MTTTHSIVLLVCGNIKEVKDMIFRLTEPDWFTIFLISCGHSRRQNDILLKQTRFFLIFSTMRTIRETDSCLSLAFRKQTVLLIKTAISSEWMVEICCSRISNLKLANTKDCFH